ncbi:hypothetical protein BJV82DRAFT_671130 [Fennellomyces sp. T-0311]|nr:hypothetical protein BJV82DRAFT_671130 [Fennellomyces sp. T-0311]
MQYQFRYRSPCRGITQSRQESSLNCIVACKKRRRGCFWEENSTVCVRCTKLRLECHSTYDRDDDDDVLPKEYGSKTLEYWHHQVDQLYSELKHAEYSIQQYTNTEPSQEVQWKLSIEDGLLKLHTMITTLEELVMYSRASLRYLSPFRGLFNGTPIRFENSAIIYIMRGYRSMINGVITPLESYPPVYRDQWVSEGEPYRPIIDQLVHWYLKHRNPQRPLLHAPSYLEHYRNLSDPLSCPITLAICVTTVCHIKQLGGYSAVQRRQMADFFYTKAKNILLEIFDDPKRKIETLYTITFLQHFIIYILLQPLEARRLATIAILICEDLQLSFKNENPS